eukprot:717587-Rhodomonas_salina.1
MPVARVPELTWHLRGGFGCRVRKQRLAPYDKMLKAFNYGGALDAALVTCNPEVVASVLHELALRDSMGIALAGRDEEALLPLLRFVSRHLTNQAYASLLTDTAALLLELYTVCAPPPSSRGCGDAPVTRKRPFVLQPTRMGVGKDVWALTPTSRDVESRF